MIRNSSKVRQGTLYIFMIVLVSIVLGSRKSGHGAVNNVAHSCLKKVTMVTLPLNYFRNKRVPKSNNESQLFLIDRVSLAL